MHENNIENTNTTNLLQTSTEPTMQNGTTPISIPTQPRNHAHTKPQRNIIIAIAITLAIIITIIIFFILNNKYNKVKFYCMRNGLEIVEGKNQTDPKVEYIICQSKNNSNYFNTSHFDNKSTNSIVLVFNITEKPFTEFEEYKTIINGEMGSGTTLEESDEYLKIYATTTDATANYLIVNDNTCIQLMASDNNLAKTALIEMGYPDRNWPVK